MACKRCLLSATKITQEIIQNNYKCPPFECQIQWRKLGVLMWNHPVETNKANKQMYGGLKPCLLHKPIISHPYYWHDANGDNARFEWVLKPRGGKENSHLNS